MRQSSKNLPVVLAFDGNAADAFFVECPVGEPTGIGHNHHTASARFGSGEQTAGLVAGAFWRFLVQIVHHERAWFRLGAKQELHIIGGRAEPVFAHNRGNHFALQVDNLDAWERHLDSLRTEHLPRKRRPDGAWQVFLRDPDEHVIELFTPPPAN